MYCEVRVGSRLDTIHYPRRVTLDALPMCHTHLLGGFRSKAAVQYNSHMIPSSPRISMHKKTCQNDHMYIVQCLHTIQAHSFPNLDHLFIRSQMSCRTASHSHPHAQVRQEEPSDESQLHARGPPGSKIRCRPRWATRAHLRGRSRTRKSRSPTADQRGW